MSIRVGIRKGFQMCLDGYLKTALLEEYLFRLDDTACLHFVLRTQLKNILLAMSDADEI